MIRGRGAISHEIIVNRLKKLSSESITSAFLASGAAFSRFLVFIFITIIRINIIIGALLLGCCFRGTARTDPEPGQIVNMEMLNVEITDEVFVNIDSHLICVHAGQTG